MNNTHQQYTQAQGGYDGYDGEGFWSQYGGGPVDAYVYEENEHNQRNVMPPTNRLDNSTSDPASHPAGRERPYAYNNSTSQGRQPGRPPLIPSGSPKSLGFDNPFPVFPSKSYSDPATASLAQKTDGLSIRSGTPNERQGETPPSVFNHRPAAAPSRTPIRRMSPSKQTSQDPRFVQPVAMPSRAMTMSANPPGTGRGLEQLGARMAGESVDMIMPPRRAQTSVGIRTREGSVRNLQDRAGLGVPGPNSHNLQTGSSRGFDFQGYSSRDSALEAYMPDFGPTSQNHQPADDPTGLHLEPLTSMGFQSPVNREEYGVPRQNVSKVMSQPDLRYQQFSQSNAMLPAHDSGYKLGDPRVNPAMRLESPIRGPQSWSSNQVPQPEEYFKHQAAGGADPPQANPDALPSHPTPIRPGLLQGNQPPTPHQRGVQTQTYSRVSHENPTIPASSAIQVQLPVTHQELAKLRDYMKEHPTDSKTQLMLAKRLVEAAGVLSDDGGRADAKTRNKNREKFIFEAHKNLKKLVSHNDPEAMFYLADCYGTGQLGLAVDPKEAFSLYQAAAKLGHAGAAYRTAVCCEMGTDAGGGTRKDPLKAVQWYKRAAALGDTPAMYKLGMILLRGLLGQQPSLGEAMIWLKRAAEQADEDNPHALHELAQLYENAPRGGKIIRDEPYAFQLYEKAARLGYRLSQGRLGRAFEYGELGCAADNRSSIHWYSKAAAQDDIDAALALSGWYLTGSPGILEQSDQEAFLWARKAALKEMPKAEFAMGYFSEVGIGCPRSLDDAKRWYGRAATHNYGKAKERLEQLKRGGSRVQRNRERWSRNGNRQQDDCVVM